MPETMEFELNGSDLGEFKISAAAAAGIDKAVEGDEPPEKKAVKFAQGLLARTFEKMGSA